MKLTPELHLLVLVATATVFMWLPYMLGRIATRGLARSLANPDPSFQPDPTWAQRARAAHWNAVENLVVFAPLVIVAAIAGISTPATILACQIYLAARIVHYVVYTAGIPGLRTIAFGVGFAATLSLAGASGASSPAARLRLPSWSDLKSVSYQPPPFRRNTGAETSRLSVCFLQLGHLRIGGSEIFCKAST